MRLTVLGCRQEWEEVDGDLSEYGDDESGREFASRLVELGGKRDLELSGSGDEGGCCGLAQAAEGLAHYFEVHGPFGHRTGRGGRPVLRVAGGVSGEEVVEGAGRGVALGECLTESPGLAQGGDQGGVAVLLVVHRT